LKGRLGWQGIKKEIITVRWVVIMTKWNIANKLKTKIEGWGENTSG
jgi:hypothetical protein